MAKTIFAVADTYINQEAQNKLMLMRQAGLDMSKEFENWLIKYELPKGEENVSSEKNFRSSQSKRHYYKCTGTQLIRSKTPAVCNKRYQENNTNIRLVGRR